MSVRYAIVSLLGTAGLLMAGCSASTPGAPAPVSAAPNAPNIVVIMTDDQTLEDLSVMRNTVQQLGDQGMTFSNAFVSYSLCCPSRATFLTGQHAHSNGVEGNEPPFGGYDRLDHTNTLPVWLSNGGYRTALVGKYLNGYGRDNPEVYPPGWSEWFGTVGESAYRMYDYTVNDDGILRKFGTGSDAYQTDVLATEAISSIRRVQIDDRPLFLWFTPLAPHAEAGEGRGEDRGGRNPDPSIIGSPRPAPRHVRSFADVPLPNWPSFNEADVSDKTGPVVREEVLPEQQVSRLQDDYRARRESLLAVDDAVSGIMSALREVGELDNTLVVFTSDNGFMLGQHRRIGKILPYEESIHVPLLVRGPGFPAGATSSVMTSNVDLASTILRASGVVARRPIEGVALQDLMADQTGYADRAILLETQEVSRQGAPYVGLRTDRYTYVEWETGGAELYDDRVDPAQLASMHAAPANADLVSRLSALTKDLGRCSGPECIGRFDE